MKMKADLLNVKKMQNEIREKIAAEKAVRMTVFLFDNEVNHCKSVFFLFFFEMVFFVFMTVQFSFYRQKLRRGKNTRRDEKKIREKQKLFKLSKMYTN